MLREKPDHEFVVNDAWEGKAAAIDACAKSGCGKPRAEHMTLEGLIKAIEEHRSVRYGDRTPDYTVDIRLYEFAGIG